MFTKVDKNVPLVFEEVLSAVVFEWKDLFRIDEGAFVFWLKLLPLQRPYRQDLINQNQMYKKLQFYT